MPLPYGFISLDESQLQRRRHLLDFYGQTAQLSAFLVLLAFQLPFVLRFLLPSGSSPQTPGKEHASPVVSRFRDQSTDANYDRVPVWRRLNWFLDQHLRWAAVGLSWGTWRVLLITSIWTIWLSVLAVKDTGDGMSRASPFLLSFQNISPISIFYHNPDILQTISTLPNASVSSAPPNSLSTTSWPSNHHGPQSPI